MKKRNVARVENEGTTVKAESLGYHCLACGMFLY